MVLQPLELNFRSYRINSLINYVFALFVVFFAAGCTSKYYISAANKIASDSKLDYELISTNSFEIVTYYRIEDKKKSLHVYFEGDGHAYTSYGRVSVNPSPRNPVALKLAASDDWPNVLYIARPYQFTQLDSKSNISSKFWTSDRYSQLVINELGSVVDKYMKKYGLTNLNLFGFSGGGTVATILSANRDDVECLITVAANLDHIKHSMLHKVPILTNSLNPIDFAQKLRKIKQIHFVGSEDKVVPYQVTESYLKSLGKPNENIIVYQKKGYNHHHPWVQDWPEILKSIE